MSAKVQPRGGLEMKLALSYEYQRAGVERCLSFPGGYVLPPCWGPSRPVWTRLARLCRHRGIDPVRYIRCTIDPVEVITAGAPEPNQLLSPDRMTAHVRELEGVPRRLVQKLNIEKRIALTEIEVDTKFHGDPEEEAVHATLGSGCLELSPLFRYCLAVKYGTKRLETVADVHLLGALVQYSLHPREYDAAYGPLLPQEADLADRAERAYLVVIGFLTLPARKGVGR